MKASLTRSTSKYIPPTPANNKPGGGGGEGIWYNTSDNSYPYPREEVSSGNEADYAQEYMDRLALENDPSNFALTPRRPPTALEAGVDSIFGNMLRTLVGIGKGAEKHFNNATDVLADPIGALSDFKDGLTRILGNTIEDPVGTAQGAIRGAYNSLKNYTIDKWQRGFEGAGEAAVDVGVNVATGKLAFKFFGFFGRGKKVKPEVVAPRAVPTQVGKYKLTDTVANHADDVVKRGPFKGERARPFLNSPHTIDEIITGGKGVPDKFVDGALRYDVPGTFRGRSGIWELVVDPKNNTIYHFNFVGN